MGSLFRIKKEKWRVSTTAESIQGGMLGMVCRRVFVGRAKEITILWEINLPLGYGLTVEPLNRKSSP